MATVNFNCNKDARVADNGTSLGAGASDWNPVGTYSGYEYRTLLGFSYSFSGMVSITSAILHLRTSTQYYVGFGSDPDIYACRVSATWSEGTSVSLSGSNAVEWSNQPGLSGTASAATDISTSESTWDTIDITAMMEAARAAGVFYGLRLYAASSSSTDVTEFYSREQGTSDPYISVTYTTNVAPNAPVSLSPTGGQWTTAVPTYGFTHSDNDGDALLDYDLQVSTDSSFASVTHWNIAAQTAGISGNNVSRAHGGTALTRGTYYYWRARTSANAGILTEGPWSAAQQFYVNQLPTFTYVTPSAADALVEMTLTPGSGLQPRMVVRWSFNDPEGGAQSAYQVVVTTDVPAAFHDTGKVASSATSVTIPVNTTRTTLYRVTITVWDNMDEANTAVSYRRCKAQWAVEEYKVDLAGTVTAWSTVANSTGGTNKLVVTEYASSATDVTISTWYSTIASAALARWFHWRVFLFAWSGATTPAMDKMSLTYTSATGVPPDGWTINAQHALDTGTKVYGTQSLRATCNAVAQSAYQLVPVERNTDYILSGRIKSDGNSGALIAISTYGTGGAIALSSSATATQDWTRTQTPIWNSGENDSIYVRCYVSGAAATFAWFDALKMEASRVVTPWTPGFVGKGLSIDAGGISIDASAVGQATMRLLGSTGGARDTVELGASGLVFGGDTELYSAISGEIRTANKIRADGGFVVGDVTTNNSGSYSNGSIELFSANPLIDFKTTNVDYGARIIYDFNYTDGIEFVGAANYNFDNTLHHTGFLRAGGTSFPASPTTDDRYYRTDVDAEFFYDGARWVTTQLLSSSSGGELNSATYFTGTAITRTILYAMNMVPPFGTDIYIEGFSASCYVASGGSALSGSHYWTLEILKGTAIVPTTSIASVAINSGANDTTRGFSAAANALLGLSNPLITYNVTMTGTPGALYTRGVTVFYRIVQT